MIDAVAPRVPLRERGSLSAVVELHLVERAAGELAHRSRLGSIVAQHVGRQRAREVAAEHAVVAKLVSEGRRGLEERHGAQLFFLLGVLVFARTWTALHSAAVTLVTESRERVTSCMPEVDLLVLSVDSETGSSSG